MKHRRVLLVEDEAMIALHITQTLGDAGYVAVGPAGFLASALQLAENETLDCAVLDVSLDGVQVWPVADVLQRRGIPFVLLSGFGGGVEVPDAHRRAPRLGKPFREAALLETLARLPMDANASRLET
jgi:DNA-binding response OmpR family regulator